MIMIIIVVVVVVVVIIIIITINQTLDRYQKLGGKPPRMDYDSYKVNHRTIAAFRGP